LLIVLTIGKPEVGNAHSSISTDKDIVRLEVTMYQPHSMRGGEPPCGWNEYSEDILPGARFLMKPSGKRLALDEFHGHKNVSFKGPNIVNGEDVWM
jgi:hypothetical protein